MKVWPSIIGGGSAIIIEPMLNRKFLIEPVVFHYVYAKISTMQAQTGPHAVIIVDTRFVAENLKSYFDLLNKNFTNQVRVKTVLDGYGMEAEEVGMLDSGNPCYVLIDN